LRIGDEIMGERWMEEVEVELCTKIEMIMVERMVSMMTRGRNNWTVTSLA
jgi:hypothetical protein